MSKLRLWIKGSTLTLPKGISVGGDLFKEINNNKKAADELRSVNEVIFNESIITDTKLGNLTKILKYYRGNNPVKLTLIDCNTDKLTEKYFDLLRINNLHVKSQVNADISSNTIALIDKIFVNRRGLEELHISGFKVNKGDLDRLFENISNSQLNIIRFDNVNFGEDNYNFSTALVNSVPRFINIEINNCNFQTNINEMREKTKADALITLSQILEKTEATVELPIGISFEDLLKEIKNKEIKNHDSFANRELKLNNLIITKDDYTTLEKLFAEGYFGRLTLNNCHLDRHISSEKRSPFHISRDDNDYYQKTGDSTIFYTSGVKLKYLCLQGDISYNVKQLAGLFCWGNGTLELQNCRIFVRDYSNLLNFFHTGALVQLLLTNIEIYSGGESMIGYINPAIGCLVKFINNKATNKKISLKNCGLVNDKLLKALNDNAAKFSKLIIEDINFSTNENVSINFCNSAENKESVKILRHDSGSNEYSSASELFDNPLSNNNEEVNHTGSSTEYSKW